MAGTSNGGFLLARYLPDGTPDPSFGTGGRVVAATGSGKDVCYGVTVDPVRQRRLHRHLRRPVRRRPLHPRRRRRHRPSTAARPSSFGGDRRPGRPASSATSPTHSDGSIIAAGASGNGVIVTKVTAAGALDPTFDAGRRDARHGSRARPGRRRTSARRSPDFTEGLAVQSDGKILVANRTGAGDFGVARLNADGSPDTAFGTGGLATTDFGGDDDADVVAIQIRDARLRRLRRLRPGHTVSSSPARQHPDAGATAASSGGGRALKHRRHR